MAKPTWKEKTIPKEDAGENELRSRNVTRLILGAALLVVSCFIGGWLAWSVNYAEQRQISCVFDELYYGLVDDNVVNALLDNPFAHIGSLSPGSTEDPLGYSGNKRWVIEPALNLCKLHAVSQFDELEHVYPTFMDVPLLSHYAKMRYRFSGKSSWSLLQNGTAENMAMDWMTLDPLESATEGRSLEMQLHVLMDGEERDFRMCYYVHDGSSTGGLLVLSCPDGVEADGFLNVCVEALTAVLGGYYSSAQELSLFSDDDIGECRLVVNMGNQILNRNDVVCNGWLDKAVPWEELVHNDS